MGWAGDEMARLLLGLGLGSALLTAVMTWAVARRYGRRRALVVPILALVAVGLMVGRAGMADPEAAVQALSAAAMLGGPAVAGGFLGLALSGRPRR